MSSPINYLQTMLGMLTSGYTRQDIRNARHGLPMETNIGRLFSTFAWGLQIIHEQNDKILLWDNIDNAEGTVLDRYGANFGVRRNGANDAFYRLMIKVKMIAQLSGGDIDAVVNAASSLFSIPPDAVDLEEVFPAKVIIYVDEELLSPESVNMANATAQMMKRIVAAGIGMQIIFRVTRACDTTVYFCSGIAQHADITIFPAN